MLNTVTPASYAPQVEASALVHTLTADVIPGELVVTDTPPVIPVICSILDSYVVCTVAPSIVSNEKASGVISCCEYSI